MKQWLTLYKDKFNKYIVDKLLGSPHGLYQLYMFIANDYHTSNVELLTMPRNAFDFTFLINDLENNIAYIGIHYDDPDHEFFHNDEEYFNETNSCKITHDNFNEFSKQWIQLKKDLPPFALIYRDNFDWISCKSFDTQQAMEDFVKNYKDELVH